MQYLHSFLATDGLELHGLLHQSGHRRCVIHVHGLAGNFYKDWYTDLFVQEYDSQGYDYFTFNNRGADFVKSLKYPLTDRRRWQGYSYELFEESQADIAGALTFLKTQGYDTFILQGHSSGCQKIIYTLSVQDLPEVEKVVLLSPCDDRGFALREWGEKGLGERLEMSVREPGLHTSSDFFFGMLVSGETLYNHFHPESPFNCFHYYDTQAPFTAVEKNKRPTQVIFGSEDFVIDYDIVRDVFSRFENYQLHIISGAGHKYDGFEKELKAVIHDFGNQELN